MKIDNLKITLKPESSAFAVFDKSRTFKNEKKTSSGSVEQEHRFVKQNGKWQIISEKELFVHFISNRVSQEANASPANVETTPNAAATGTDSEDQSAPKK